MRGDIDPQAHLFSYLSPEARIPATHPLRPLKQIADTLLQSLATTFQTMYSETGRPSIPPERLLKAQLLIALYSVRSDRLFCEQLDYNILFRWFLDLSLEAPVFDHSVFSKNSERLLTHAVAQRFFEAVVGEARRRGLLSDEHFTVDGTLIEAWASLKSFRPRAVAEAPAVPPDDPGNPTVNFHGERRTNATHQSTTDPEARLMRKGQGKEARLCVAGHVLMENRHGLCVDLCVTPAMGTAEREAALIMVSRQTGHGIRPQTLGGDKGYHTTDFVQHVRQCGIRPHLAQVTGRRTAGLDRRTTRHASYRLSQRRRKLVEEIFGWLKTVGGFRKTRHRGLEKVDFAGYLVGAAYNLVRLARLVATPTPA
jgi:transposase